MNLDAKQVGYTLIAIPDPARLKKEPNNVTDKADEISIVEITAAWELISSVINRFEAAENVFNKRNF